MSVYSLSLTHTHIYETKQKMQTQLKNKKVQIKPRLLPYTAKYPPTCCEFRYCNWQCYVCLCLHFFNAPLHPLKPYDLTWRGESGDRKCELVPLPVHTASELWLFAHCLSPWYNHHGWLGIKKQLSVSHLVRLLVIVHQHTQFGYRRVYKN